AEVLRALDRGDGTVPAATARAFARRAFERTAAYDAAIAGYLGAAGPNGGPPRGGEGGSRAFPETLAPRYRLLQKLRYGENPGQEGALYASEGSTGIATLTQLKG